jgi:hypothetical protein
VRNSVSQRFGASADIIIISRSTSEGEDFNEDNHAFFAAMFCNLILAQCFPRLRLPLGIFQSTQRLNLLALNRWRRNSACCCLEDSPITGVLAGFGFEDITEIHGEAVGVMASVGRSVILLRHESPRLSSPAWGHCSERARVAV